MFLLSPRRDASAPPPENLREGSEALRRFGDERRGVVEQEKGRQQRDNEKQALVLGAL